MRKLDIQIDRIADEHTRDSFDRLSEQLREHVFGGFKGRFIEISFGAAATNRKVPHGLAFKPKDVIVLSVVPSTATVTWKYESFTMALLDVTASALCVVRAYVGTHTEEG